MNIMHFWNSFKSQTILDRKARIWYTNGVTVVWRIAFSFLKIPNILTYY